MSKLSITPGQGAGPSSTLGDYLQLIRTRPVPVPGLRPQRWRWRLLSANHAVVCWSERYTNRDDALAVMRTRFPGCRIDDLTGGSR